jgi:hypothetical protein
MKYFLILAFLLASCAKKPPEDPPMPPVPPPPPSTIAEAVNLYVTGNRNFVFNENSGFRGGTIVCPTVLRSAELTEVLINIEKWSDAGTFDVFGFDLYYFPEHYVFVSASPTPTLDNWYFNYSSSGFINESTAKVRFGAGARFHIDPGIGTIISVVFKNKTNIAKIFTTADLTDDFGLVSTCEKW